MDPTAALSTPSRIVTVRPPRVPASEIRALYVRDDGSWLEVHEYAMGGAKAAPLNKDQLRRVMTDAL